MDTEADIQVSCPRCGMGNAEKQRECRICEDPHSSYFCNVCGLQFVVWNSQQTKPKN